jgi:hypothetical protein
MWGFDSSVSAEPLLRVVVPHGKGSVATQIRAVVRNDDPTGVDPIGHRVQLAAGDGTCPAGTVSGLPLFLNASVAMQDSAFLPAGSNGSGTVPLTISREAFEGRQTCTLRLSVSTLEGNRDPTPGDDYVGVVLEVKLL